MPCTAVPGAGLGFGDSFICAGVRLPCSNDPWTRQTAQFTGERGHRYCFQCRARDNIGNEEQYPGGDGDTCTNLRTYWVEIKACPDYFVPGHENIIKYRIYPDTYTALYGKLEIFERGGSGQPTGPALYSSTDLSLNGGTEHSFLYFGDGLSEGSGDYIVKLSIGPDAFSVSTDQEAFDVRAWALVTFFWDDLTIEDKAEMIATDQEPCDPGYVEAFDPLAFDSNSGLPPYCTGVDYTTVTSAEVAVTTWYWDETEYDADSLWIDNGTPTESISDTDWVDVWGQDPLDKPWYDEHGSSIANLNGTFYSMSEPGQYFYLKMVVATSGVLDNAGNMFDADPNTPERESTRYYKLRIAGNGDIDILEEVIQ